MVKKSLDKWLSLALVTVLTAVLAVMGLAVPMAAQADSSVQQNTTYVNLSDQNISVYTGTITYGSETARYVYCPATIDPSNTGVADYDNVSITGAPYSYTTDIYSFICQNLSADYAAVLPEPGYQSTAMNGFLAYQTNGSTNVLDGQAGAQAIADLGVDWTDINSAAAFFFPGTAADSAAQSNTNTNTWSGQRTATGVSYEYINGILTPITETNVYTLNANVGFTDQTLTVADANTTIPTTPTTPTTPDLNFVPVTNITGVPDTVTAGTPLDLTATVDPANATNQTIVWSVSDAGTTEATIAGSTLNTTGAGSAVIRATITDGTASGTDYTQDFTITVDPVPAPTVAQSISYGYLSPIDPQTPVNIASGVMASENPDTLAEPGGMTFDNAGNLYLADYGVGIYKLAPGAASATLWNADIQYAFDISYYNGYLYAIDDNALYQISPATGAATILYDGFTFANSLAIDANGTIWVSDSTDSDELVYKMQPGGTGVAAQYSVPVAGMLAFGPDGYLYVSGLNASDTVYKLNPANGNVSDLQLSGIAESWAMRFDSAGNLYIADFGGNQVVKVPAGSTSAVSLGDVAGATGLAFDAAGNLYTCDYDTGSIVKFAVTSNQTLSIYTIPTVTSSVFGTAGADAYVKVTAGNQTVIVQADANGNWDATAALGALTQGQPVTAQVVGNNTGTTTVSGTVQTYVVAPPAGANYALTMKAGTGGTITAGTSGSYAQGQVINITASPNNNYKFSNWTSSNGGTFANANSAGTTFTMPASATTVTANFSLISGGSGGSGGGGGGSSYYTVSYNTNGGSTVHSQSVANGSKLTQPAAPVKDGYTFNGWYTDAALTKAFDFSKTVSGNMTLYAAWTASTTVNPTTNPSTATTTAPTVTPSAAGWQNPFADVKATDWFYGDVQYVANNNLFNGTSATAFAPNSPMTRAMFVTVLWRAAGSPSVSGSGQFKDVQTSAYYATAVNWAAQNKVVLGISSSLFAPDRQVTREQMAAILYRYQQFSGQTPSNTITGKQFADANKIGDYAKDAVNALVAQGILSGKPGNLFDPQGIATRAQVASMLHRFMQSV